MENEKFIKAKELNEKKDRLSSYLNKLYLARAKEVSDVKVNFKYGPFDTPCEFTIINEQGIAKLIEREIEATQARIRLLELEFKEL